MSTNPKILNFANAIISRVSVLECGSPLPLWHRRPVADIHFTHYSSLVTL